MEDFYVYRESENKRLCEDVRGEMMHVFIYYIKNTYAYTYTYMYRDRDRTTIFACGYDEETDTHDGRCACERGNLDKL